MKIKFGNIRSGWVDFTLNDNGDEIISDSFSYTPYDSFEDLIRAIDSFRDEYKTTKECKVLLNTEPYEYELRFNGRSDNIQLLVEGYASQKRNTTKDKIYAVTGSYAEICIPFWRALRSLQGSHTEKELDELWHRKFPSKELNILTSKLNG